MGKYSKIAIGLIATMTALTFAGCGNGGNQQGGTQGSQEAGKITGTVNYAVWDPTTTQKNIDLFNETYPNIKVNFVKITGAVNTFLTTQAASNNLPDLIWDYLDITYPISQGWVRPIDDFLAKDPETKYLDKNIMDTYTFGGKVYALPSNINVNEIAVNLDLLDQLNLDKPGYDWTIDQFKDYCKKATTDKYSAINSSLGEFINCYSGMLNKDLSGESYNLKTNKFDLTSGSWIKAVTLAKELHAVPGLLADDLKNPELTKAGKEDDYQKKFGKGADGFKEGKILFGDWGTWADSGLRSGVSFKFDLYPLPRDPEVGYRGTIHVDHMYMMNTVKDAQATYELMKWLTSGKDGNLKRLNAAAKAVNKEGKPTPSYFIPSTKEPEVVKAFKAMENVPEGVKYMYDNMDKGFRADHFKFVPSFIKIRDEILKPAKKDIISGKSDPSAIAADLEKKANAIADEARGKFEAMLKDVQQKESQQNNTKKQ